MEAVEQQGRRKGDSDCLFHIRGQFCSVPLQLEEHVSSLMSANLSSAAPGEACLIKVLFFPKQIEDTIISKIRYLNEEIGQDVVIDTYIELHLYF